MVRMLGATLVLSLMGAPAMAQTSKKKNPTKVETTIEADKSEPESEPEPEPEPKKKSKKRSSEEEEVRDEKKEEAAPETPDSKKFIPGVSLLLGPALSTNNSGGKLTPLPFASLAFSLDSALGKAWYFRLEPSLGYLRRKSTVNVIRRVDASKYPTVKVQTEDLVNRVTAIDFSIRAMMGYHYTENLTGRVGLLFGLSSASTSAEDCSSDNRTTKAIYGAHLTPIAKRISLGKSKLEIGISAELRSQTLPRCDVPIKGEFEVKAKEIATFTPKRVDASLTSVAVALQGAFFF